MIERLLEWQHDLADKLGVTIQELQDIPLPTEGDLEKLKNHLTVLQAERDKRAEIFLNTQVEIKDIMGTSFIVMTRCLLELLISTYFSSPIPCL